jgi:hypothetical protein
MIGKPSQAWNSTLLSATDTQPFLYRVLVAPAVTTQRTRGPNRLRSGLESLFVHELQLGHRIPKLRFVVVLLSHSSHEGSRILLSQFFEIRQKQQHIHTKAATDIAVLNKLR